MIPPLLFSSLRKTSRLSWLVLVSLLTLSSGAFSATVVLSSQEQALLNIMRGSGQHRPFLQVDPILTQVARAHAADMAAHHYYAHEDQSGHGPNWQVENAGYKLPAGYISNSANNIESIDAGYSSASTTWNTLMGDAPHKEHLEAENSFYAAQTSVGIGYVANPNSDYQYYWVIITAPPQPTPTLTILTPASGAQVAVGQASLTGTTGGGTPAATVVFRVENSAGTGAFQVAGGVTAWSGTAAGLVPGPNTLRVRSLDSSNKVLVEKTRGILYAVPSPLAVSVTGIGTVTPGFAGTTQRDLGVGYTVTATPAAGFLFNGWTGSATARSAALSFVMAAGTNLTANFVPNPFSERKGGYTSLLSGGAGEVKISLTGSGLFTGVVLFEGKSYIVQGRLAADGTGTVTIPRRGTTPLTATFQLDVTDGADTLSATVSDGTTTATTDATRNYQPAAGPYPHAGRYTVVLPPDENNPDATLPQGAGFASLVITKSGRATLVGDTADGAAFAYAHQMAENDTLPIYIASSLKTLSGSLTIAATSVSDLQGTLHWTRAAIATARIHPAAFATDLPVVGSAYVRTAANAASPTQATDQQLLLAEGGLSAPVMQVATLNRAGQLVFSGPVLPGLQAHINAVTGTYGGSFVHPVTHALSPIHGVLFQKQNAGFGFFVSAHESGSSSLSPAQ
jgi:uncharacterized repeat protein (TIGR02543 family)